VIAQMTQQPRDARGNRGAIVNIGSIASFGGIPGRNAYCAAKAGVLGMTRALASEWARRGIRVIAMSRFGYLRTPMPADASAQAQADAHVCLLDALGISQAAVLGGSAGAPSALQMAIRHPDRVTALILLAPLAYKPPTQADSAAPMAPWVENTMMAVIGSDFLFWSATHLARAEMVAVQLPFIFHHHII
jgi:NAD(P)-dependent dehydrogenase (short-subunit alcohol dehydrogenase family)